MTTLRCLSTFVVSQLELKKIISSDLLEIVTRRWTTEDVPKQTKAKSEEYRVKLGRLRCGLRGRSYSIVTIAHSLNRTTIWLRLHRRQWP